MPVQHLRKDNANEMSPRYIDFHLGGGCSGIKVGTYLKMDTFIQIQKNGLLTTELLPTWFC